MKNLSIKPVKSEQLLKLESDWNKSFNIELPFGAQKKFKLNDYGKEPLNSITSFLSFFDFLFCIYVVLILLDILEGICTVRWEYPYQDIKCTLQDTTVLTSDQV